MIRKFVSAVRKRLMGILFALLVGVCVWQGVERVAMWKAWKVSLLLGVFAVVLALASNFYEKSDEERTKDYDRAGKVVTVLFIYTVLFALLMWVVQ